MRRNYINTMQKQTILLTAFFVLLHIANLEAKKEYKKLYANNPVGLKYFETPVFPKRAVSITDFGASGDGKIDNTEAIRKSIEWVNSRGGGYVDIPAGVWLTGPIELLSNVCLRTTDKTIVVFTTDFDKYPLVKTYYEGAEGWRVKSPVYAKNAENIAICGKGIFDGNGNFWRPVKQSNVTKFQWREYITSGGVLDETQTVWFPTKRAMEGSKFEVLPSQRTYEQSMAIKEWLRPVMVNLINCKNIFISGTSFKNSPAWCIHPVLCENITIEDVHVKNDDWAANGDALDLESCKNVLLVNSHFDAGDDGICLKSGKDEEGRKRGVPTENVRIDNCSVYNGHGGFVVGSEMSGGVKNIYLTNCRFAGTDNGLRFKSTRGRGGVVENIQIENVMMVNIKSDAILYDLYYGKPKNEAVEIREVNEETPQFRNIKMVNIYCNGANRAAIFQGLPEMKLENILLENSVIVSKTGIEYKDVSNVRIKNTKIYINNRTEEIFENVDLSNR